MAEGEFEPRANATSSCPAAEQQKLHNPEALPVSERYKDVDLEEVIAQLEKEKAELQSRLEFVEELVGPTEAQRKNFQQQLIAARGAALRAKRCGVPIPTRFVGRLDERWLRSRGMSERDCALLQRGCVTGQDGLPKDISLLGDPCFKPYYEATLEPRWEIRGGSLNLSLGDIRDRWGEEVALEVHRCAIELDRYDASRRLGIELPWFALEKRELQPCEIIRLMEREISARADEVQSDGGRSDTGLHSIDSPEPPELEDSSRRTTREGISTPTLSVMESVISTGTVTSTAPDNIGCADDEHDLERYEWSLADADIEQLLQAGKAGGSRLLSSTQAGSEGIPESEVDNEEEALLELLEEEVTGSLGLLSPSPDMSIGTPL
jgi:hypothetical protein